MSAQPRWDDTAPAQRPVAVLTSGVMVEPDRNTARIVSVIALASIAAGAINIAAAATIGGDNAPESAIVDTSRQGDHTLPRHIAAPQGQDRHRTRMVQPRRGSTPPTEVHGGGG